MIQDMTAGEAMRPGVATRALTPVVRNAARLLLRWQPSGSITVELPNGQRYRFGQAAGRDEPLLKLRSYRALAKALARGPIGFAAAYIDNDIECTNLVGLFRFFLQNREHLEKSGRGLFKVRIGDRLAHLMRHNSRQGSRRNISEHYDLGNEFYGHWLDDGMNYSSGLYDSGTRSLEEAQEAKLEAILQMLDLEGGESVLEIGCGWGAFARRAAREHGASVTGLTLSQEQLVHARDQAAANGLGDRCTFRLQDYRDAGDAYDRIVSIEMIEAVGEEHWSRYFRTIHDRLKPGGTAVIQSITMDEARFEKYRCKTDFIQRYIFPGGMLPTPSAIEREAKQAGLVVERNVNFGKSYAQTLREWRERFETAWPEIAKLGFDEAFRRKWNYYLCYCEAGFLEDVIDVGMYRLRRPTNSAA